MGNTIWPAFVALILSGAFAQSCASAQTEGTVSPAQSGNQTAVVSVDLLRHPITAKVQRLLLAVMVKMESGSHEAAIGQLLEMLTKYPDSAPYVYNLLGVEYVKTDQFDAAVWAFGKAVLKLPHDAMTHYSFGLALVCVGDYERAAQEVRLAVKLDPGNAKMQAKLNALLQRKAADNRDSAEATSSSEPK